MKCIILLLAFAVAALAQPQAPITDARDGKTYRAVKIGEQIWMAENLNYAAKGSRCYENKAENCAKHGRLYDWDAAMKACPDGWHLPKNEEWEMLSDYAENAQECYGRCDAEHLKATSDWFNKGNGLDTYGFSALPGGLGSSSGIFGDANGYAYWWSATGNGVDSAYYRWMNFYDSFSNLDYNSKTSWLRSVRCARD